MHGVFMNHFNQTLPVSSGNEISIGTGTQENHLVAAFVRDPQGRDIDELPKLVWPRPHRQTSQDIPHLSKLKASTAGWRHYIDKTAPTRASILSLFGTISGYSFNCCIFCPITVQMRLHNVGHGILYERCYMIVLALQWNVHSDYCTLGEGITLTACNAPCL